MDEREQREHWHLRALEAEALAEERGREIGRQKALAEATQLECNRLADDMKRAEAELRLKEADYRVLEDKVCDFEARLAKVVEAAKILSPNARDHILAAAQPEEPVVPGRSAACPRCGGPTDLKHACLSLKCAPQPEEESRG